MLKTVDNFQGELDLSISKAAIKKLDADIGYKGFLSKTEKNLKLVPIHITFAAYQRNHPNDVLFDMLGSSDKKSDNDLILSIAKGVGDQYIAQAGNYVGKFTWKGLDVDIQSRFPRVFMMRMLNVANDVYLDDVATFDAQASKDLDFSKFIIYYLFVQKLEKAFLLGLPKAYRTIQHHDMKLKGRIDINRFIKHDIPFQGKIASVSREQKEIQEIIDMLFKAVQVIEKHGKGLLKNIKQIHAHLKQHKSNQYVSAATMQKAMASKALHNPIFSSYKSLLGYAKLIVDGDNLEEKPKGKEQTFGFLVNIAELFEIYVRKLLQQEFPDWEVSSPQEVLYPDQFYFRKIIPDIIMKHRLSNTLMVFDTKYKRMLMRGTKENVWDVDRNDFFQINTYMSYYQNSMNNYKLIAGGLLYPIEGDFYKNIDKCYSNTWLGNDSVKFVVDGIDLHSFEANDTDEDVKNKIKQSERDFIARIKAMGRESSLGEEVKVPDTFMI